VQKASVQSTYSTLTVFAGPWQSTVYCLQPSMLCWVSVLHRLLTDWQWQCNERLFISIAVQLAWSIHTTAPTQCIQIKLTPLMLWRVWTPGWNMAAKITGCPRLVTQHCWWRWWTHHGFRSPGSTITHSSLETKDRTKILPEQFCPTHLNNVPELMSCDSQLYQQLVQHQPKFAEKV